MLFIIILVTMFIGAGLGAYFRVFVLIPATFVSLIVAGSVSLAYGYDFQSFVIVTILSAIGLQIGYLAMTGAQALFKAFQISKQCKSEIRRGTGSIRRI